VQRIGQEEHWIPFSGLSSGLIAPAGQTFVQALQSAQRSEMKAFSSGAIEIA
jgi:hypothetical protein